jgi:hypothetical protein
MDTMNVIVGLQVNSPIDLDTEYRNSGLMYPPMSRNGTAASYFSGLYYLYTVKSSFSKGLFLQELLLGRVPNQEFVNTSPKEDPKDPVKKNQGDQRDSVPTNNSTNNTGSAVQAAYLQSNSPSPNSVVFVNQNNSVPVNGNNLLNNYVTNGNQARQ